MKAYLLTVLLALGSCGQAASPSKAAEPAPPVETAAAPTEVKSPPLVAGKATKVRANSWEGWSADESGDPRTYRIGELTLTFGSLTTETDSYGKRSYGIGLLLEAPGMDPLRFSDDEVSAITSFGVGRLDMTRPDPQLLLGIYTGGAHCCTRYVLFTPNGKTWTQSDLGIVDKSMNDWPEDRNHDGKPEMWIGDDSFNYAFASYAGSRAPYAFWQIEDGKVVDVSADKGFARLYRAYAKDAEVDCRKHDNGACAGFVAAAARAGDFDRAWKVMLDSYDRDDDWTLPTGCKVDLVEYQCPEGQEITYANYPDALRGFLEDNGYIPR